VKTDPTRMCEIPIDLLDFDIRGVEGKHRGPLTIRIECRREVMGCPESGAVARVKDRHQVSLESIGVSHSRRARPRLGYREHCPAIKLRVGGGHQQLVMPENQSDLAGVYKNSGTGVQELRNGFTKTPGIRTELAQIYGVHPTQITQWKKQLD
jgi:hypothetical protein